MKRQDRRDDAYGLALLALILSGLALVGVLLWWVAAPEKQRSFDSIAFSLAALQTFLIVVALGGYWTIRNAAIAAAEAEARRVSESTAEGIAKKVAEDLARATARGVAEEIVKPAMQSYLPDRDGQVDDQAMRDELDSK